MSTTIHWQDRAQCLDCGVWLSRKSKETQPKRCKPCNLQHLKTIKVSVICQECGVSFTANRKTAKLCHSCRKARQAQNSIKQNVKRQKHLQGVKQAEIAKRGYSCSICGLVDSKDLCIFDFHHTDPAVKNEDISRLISHGSEVALVSEMAKCILVCAVCHRRIHHA